MITRDQCIRPSCEMRQLLIMITVFVSVSAGFVGTHIIKLSTGMFSATLLFPILHLDTIMITTVQPE